MTPKTPNRHTRRAAVATAPVAPAIDASVERAAIERDPAPVADPPVNGAVSADTPSVAAADAPLDGAVLPEPTLVAEPGAPQPIVTASPILAVEPSALDVVKADAAADRVATGIEPAPDPDGAHAAAGQPTLTIEGSAADRVARTLAAGALGEASPGATASPLFGDGPAMVRELSEFRDRDPDGFARFRSALDDERVSTLDEIVRGLEYMSLSDPIAKDIIGTRFFGGFAADRDDPSNARFAGEDVDTVTVLEVVGPPQGRRRAGMAFCPTPQRFFASVLTVDELAALRADPLLAVGVSEVDASVTSDDLASVP